MGSALTTTWNGVVWAGATGSGVKRCDELLLAGCCLLPASPFRP